MVCILLFKSQKSDIFPYFQVLGENEHLSVAPQHGHHRSCSISDWSHPLSWLEPSPVHWWPQTHNSWADSSIGLSQSSSFNHLLHSFLSHQHTPWTQSVLVGNSSSAKEFSDSVRGELNELTQHHLCLFFFLSSDISNGLSRALLTFLDKFSIFALFIISMVIILAQPLLFHLDYEGNSWLVPLLASSFTPFKSTLLTTPTFLQYKYSFLSLKSLHWLSITAKE